MADKSAANLIANIEREPQDDAGALSLRARHPPRRRDDGQGPGAPLRRPRAAAPRRAWSSCSRWPTSDRSSPRASAHFFAEAHNQQVIDALLAAGFDWPESAGAGKASPQPLAGKTFVLTGTLPTLARDDAKEMIESLRRQGGRLGVEEDRLRRRRHRGRDEAREGPSRSTSSCSTRPTCSPCWDGMKNAEAATGALPLDAAADLPPAAPRASLWLDGARGRQHRTRAGDAPRRARACRSPPRRGLGWRIAGPADASLVAIAHWLHERGLSARWRDELLAVTRRTGARSAAIERASSASSALRPRRSTWSVSTADGRRSGSSSAPSTRSTDPGLWDTLMGGQVAPANRSRTTLVRETRKRPDSRSPTWPSLAHCAPITIRRPVREGYMVEHIEVFRGDSFPMPSCLSISDGEVERFDCLATQPWSSACARASSRSRRR